MSGPALSFCIISDACFSEVMLRPIISAAGGAICIVPMPCSFPIAAGEALPPRPLGAQRVVAQAYADGELVPAAFLACTS